MIRLALEGLAEGEPEERGDAKALWKEAVRVLLNVSCVQKSKFYIPGETAENERFRAIVNSNGLYLALRALAERAECRELRTQLQCDFV